MTHFRRGGICLGACGRFDLRLRPSSAPTVLRASTFPGGKGDVRDGWCRSSRATQGGGRRARSAGVPGASRSRPNEQWNAPAESGS